MEQRGPQPAQGAERAFRLDSGYAGRVRLWVGPSTRGQLGSGVVAEGVGFEPTRAQRGALAIFKTAPFSRSGTPPHA